MIFRKRWESREGFLQQSMLTIFFPNHHVPFICVTELKGYASQLLEVYWMTGLAKKIKLFRVAKNSPCLTTITGTRNSIAKQCGYKVWSHTITLLSNSKPGTPLVLLEQDDPHNFQQAKSKGKPVGNCKSPVACKQASGQIGDCCQVREHTERKDSKDSIKKSTRNRIS